MHKGLLCAVSGYSEAALQGGFKEAEEQRIELPEEDPETIEHFQLWLYTKSILDTNESAQHTKYPILVDLYVFAESHLIPKLQNITIDTIIQKINIESNVPRISAMYKNTIDGSPLRRLITHFTARNGILNKWSWDIGNEEKLCSSKEYLRDVILALYEGKEKPQEQDCWKIRCDYHVHSEGDPPCSKS